MSAGACESMTRARARVIHPQMYANIGGCGCSCNSVSSCDRVHEERGRGRERARAGGIHLFEVDDSLLAFEEQFLIFWFFVRERERDRERGRESA